MRYWIHLFAQTQPLVPPSGDGGNKRRCSTASLQFSAKHSWLSIAVILRSFQNILLLTPLSHLWPTDTHTHTHITTPSKQNLEKLCHISSIHVETPDISSQELHSVHRHTHTHIYIVATGRAYQNYQGGRGRGGESRACPKTTVSTSGGKLDDSGLLLSQLLFLLTWKSDVATNPKISLSHSLTCSPSLSASPLSLSLFRLASLQTRALFIFILLQQHKLLLGCYFQLTHIHRSRAEPRACTHSRAHARLITLFLCPSVTQHLILCAFIPTVVAIQRNFLIKLSHKHTC